VQPRSERNRGLVFTMAGVAILVAALLYGLTKTSNGETVADWVSIITAIGGLIVGGVGLLHDVARARWWNGTDRPHAARTVMTADSLAFRSSEPLCRGAGRELREVVAASRKALCGMPSLRA